MPYRRRYTRNRGMWNQILLERTFTGLRKQDADENGVSMQTYDIVENSLPNVGDDDFLASAAYPSAAPVLRVKHAQANIIIPQSPHTVAISHIEAFICYLPQGVPWDAKTPIFHPEWVMARRICPLVQGGSTAIYMKSPLVRNLNSGDRIVLVLRVTYLAEANEAASIIPIAQTLCVTKAN